VALLSVELACAPLPSNAQLSPLLWKGSPGAYQERIVLGEPLPSRARTCDEYSVSPLSYGYSSVFVSLVSHEGLKGRLRRAYPESS